MTNDIRKERILSCYNETTLEKGGKPAFIGEVRTFKGIEYIKTDNGWRPASKGASAAVTTTTTAAASFIPSYRWKVQENLQSVLNQAEPFLNERVEKYVEHEAQKGKEVTERDKEFFKLNITIDLVKAFSRYIKPNDQVEVLSFRRGRGGATEAVLQITRDGVKYKMSTEMIIASGAIQHAHYRYISHTTLSASENKSAYDKLVAERNKMTKQQKIEADIRYAKHIYDRDIASFNALKAKTYEEVLEDRFVGLNWTYESMNAGGKANFDNDPNQFAAYIEKRRRDVWQDHLDRTKDSVLRKIHSEYSIKINRLQGKLNELKL